MKRNLLFFVILCFFLLPGKGLLAQADYVNRNVSDFMNNVEFHNNVNKLPPDLVGSPYLNNDFEKGNIYLEGKYKFNDVLLRYNIYNDVMEFKDHGHLLDLDERHKIDSIQLQGNTFVYHIEPGQSARWLFRIADAGQSRIIGKVENRIQGTPACKTPARPRTTQVCKDPGRIFFEKGVRHPGKNKEHQRYIGSTGRPPETINRFSEETKVEKP